MREIILNFENQIRSGYALGIKEKISKEYDYYVIAGMGGSLVPGEIFWMLATSDNKDNQPKVFINRDYGLPNWARGNTLVICISWSGNTEETLSSFDSALSRNLDIVAITKGGKLLAKARENNIPFIDLEDKNYPARFGVGYQLGALLGVLGISLKNLSIEPSKHENEARVISDNIGAKIPLIYSSFEWRKIANFWKTLFNENAKIPAFWNSLPALSHNEIEGLAKTKDLIYPIIVQADSDSLEVKKSISATIAIFDELGYNYSTIDISKSGSLLDKILDSYIFGLWVSFHLATKLNINLEATPIISRYKELRG